MPSSLIFTGLVVLWLLILVPAVARHQQEVARPSGASLAGRVLARPRRERRLEGHPSEERDTMDDDAHTSGTRPTDGWVPAARMGAQRSATAVQIPEQSGRDGADDDADVVEDDAELDDELDDELDLERDGQDDVEPDDGPEEPERAPDVHDDSRVDSEDSGDEPEAHSEDRAWERPVPSYRPGRGGFDPEANAASARRRYAFRQRVVLLLLVTALLTAVVAVVAYRVVWWAHAGVDLVLVSYLIYLRRQVREEQAIRERRASRMAGTRRTMAADDHDLDEWARRGREVTRRPSTEAEERARTAAPEPAARHSHDGLVDELGDELIEDGDADRVRGVGEPVGLLPARRRGADDEVEVAGSALPPLRPAPPPPLPPGTSLVVVDDDELDLHDLGAAGHPHRRAVGQ